MELTVKKIKKRYNSYAHNHWMSVYCYIAVLLISQTTLAEISKPPPFVDLPPIVKESNAVIPSPVNELLQRAQKAIEAYKLTSPRAKNAEYYLSQVLQQQKGHPKALKMLIQIVDLYQNMASKQLREEHTHLKTTANYLKKSKILINKYHIRNLLKRQGTLENQLKEKIPPPPEESVDIVPIEPDMISIPGGSYKMGCVSNKGCDNNEKPVHTVQIAAFEMSKTEITFEQWDVCVQAGVCRSLPDNGWERGNHPVIFTSWDDTQSYTQWISQATGKVYRLPTEAEWEYAARAGASTAYSSGNCIHTNHANYNGNYGWGWSKCGKTKTFRGKTTPVAKFPANKFKLHNMQGNVWEWVQDCYHKSYQGAPTNGSAWETGCDRSSDDTIFRILRGGAWSVGPILLRNATRYSQDPRTSAHNAGFRIVRTQ